MDVYLISTRAAPDTSSNPATNSQSAARTVPLLLIGLFIAPLIWLYAAYTATAQPVNAGPRLRELRIVTLISQVLALCTAIELVDVWVSAYNASWNYDNASIAGELGLEINESLMMAYLGVLPVLLIIAVSAMLFIRRTRPASRTFPHSAWLIYVFWGAATARSCYAYQITQLAYDTVPGQQNDTLEELIRNRLRPSSAVAIALLTVGTIVWVESMVRALTFQSLLVQPRFHLEDNPWLVGPDLTQGSSD